MWVQSKRVGESLKMGERRENERDIVEKYWRAIGRERVSERERRDRGERER